MSDTARAAWFSPRDAIGTINLNDVIATPRVGTVVGYSP